VVTVLGMTFKENVPDTRNSRVIDIVQELGLFGIDAQVHDPLASSQEAKHEYGIALCDLDSLRPADAVIFAVAHDEYVRGGWPFVIRLLKDNEGVVLDVRRRLDRDAKPAGIELWRL
jgi:UDP-N-acetyl-D-galactosamine dehydrogenase